MCYKRSKGGAVQLMGNSFQKRIHQNTPSLFEILFFKKKKKGKTFRLFFVRLDDLHVGLPRTCSCMTPRYTLWCRLTPLSLQRCYCLQGCYYDYGLSQNEKKKKGQQKNQVNIKGVAVMLLLLLRPFLFPFFFRTRTWVICIEKLIESPLFPARFPPCRLFLLFRHLSWGVCVVRAPGEELVRNVEGLYGTNAGASGRGGKFDRNKMQSQEGVR